MSSSYEPKAFFQGDTYNERTDRFIGVDLTSPAMQASQKRGIFSNNYMLKGSGKPETRDGYEQISYSERECFLLGAWDYTDSNGRNRRVLGCMVKEHVINYRYDFYLKEASYLSNGEFVDVEWDNVIPFKYYLGGVLEEDESVSGFIEASKKDEKYLTPAFGTQSNGLLYVLIGQKYVVVYPNSINKLECCLVSDYEGTHIPTTRYMGVASNALNIPSKTDVMLEYPNALSPWRKEAFLSGLGIADGTGYYPILETSFPLNPSALKGIAVEYRLWDDSLDAFSVDLVVATLASDINAIPDHTLTAKGEDFRQNYLKQGSKLLVENDPDMIEFITHVDSQSYDDYSDSGACFGVYNHSMNERCFIYGAIDGSGNIIMFSDLLPAYTAKPNITVTYSPYYRAGDDSVYENGDYIQAASFINKCRFGVRFGANNSLNRLWLYGNPDQPNYAIHSQEPFKGLEKNPAKEDGDFTYFPDEGMIRFGEKENAIVSMNVVSVDKMAVIKNKHAQDRTMYFVAPAFVEQEVANGLSITREEYSTSMSNTSTDACLHSAVDDFNGDLLFVSSDNQVVGLDIEGITGDSQRVASTRSYFIDGALKKSDVSNAWLFHRGNSLYLSCDSKVYVANSTSFGHETAGQYEWWPCDPIPGSVLAVIHLKDDTWVSTKEHKIYRFRSISEDDDETCDIERAYLNSVTEDIEILSNGDVQFGSSFYDILPSITDFGVTEIQTGIQKETDFIAIGSAVTSDSMTEYRFEPGSIDFIKGFGSGYKTVFAYIKKSGEARKLYRFVAKIDPVEGTSAFRFIDLKGQRIPANINQYEGDVQVVSFSDYEQEEPIAAFRVDDGSSAFIRNNPARFTIGSDDIYAIPESDINFDVLDEGVPAKLALSDSASPLYRISQSALGGVFPTTIANQMANGVEMAFFTFDEQLAKGERTVAGEVSSSVVISNLYVAFGSNALYVFKKDDDECIGGLYYKSFKGRFAYAPVYPADSESLNPSGYVEFRKPIVPMFASLRMANGKLGYDKTIVNVAIWNDQRNPSELYVGSITNKSYSSEIPSKVIDPGMGIDFSAFTFEHMGFDKNKAPAIYNLKRFPRNQQTLILAFTASGKRNSVLSGVDILYHIKNARNKR